jgi:hypothetical protein
LLWLAVRRLAARRAKNYFLPFFFAAFFAPFFFAAFLAT